jgi:hypothetical protein
VPSENEAIVKATQNALKMMKNAGFEVSDKLKVTVDPALPFMGYLTQRDNVDVIVVAGKAVESGMIEGLLVHEMSHAYRTNANHPSHNRVLLNRIGYSVLRRNRLTEDYEMAVVQEAVNHIQDIYADDIAFRVFVRSEAFSLEQFFDFFLDWIDDSPALTQDAKTVWQNIGAMLNNCFVLSNMIRHNVPDIDHQAENKVQRFLSQTDDQMKEAFVYFKDFMIALKEKITEKEFKKKLTDYLTKIVDLADQQKNRAL